MNEICELNFRNDKYIYICSPDFMGMIDIYVNTLNDIRSTASLFADFGSRPVSEFSLFP